MCVLIFLKCLLICSIVYGGSGGLLTKQNGDLDSVGVEQHILQLEQTVMDLQSRFQVQEQKQAAVLSSVLSKLTSTNSRLAELEQQHSTTLLELGDANDQLKDVKRELKALKEDCALRHRDFTLLNLTRKDVVVLQTQIQSTTAALNVLQNNNTEVQSNLSTLKQELQSELKELKSNFTYEVLRQKDELNTTRNNVDAIQIRLTSTVATLVILQKEGKDMQRNLTALRAEFSNFKGEKLNKVAFSSSLSSTTNHTRGEVVRYAHVSFNMGNGYNVTTGTFSCPESGVYLFTLHGVKTNQGGFYLGIVHNDDLVSTVYSPKASVSTGASNTAMIKLNYQDTVWVKAVRDSSLNRGVENFVNTFAGYLVSPNS